VYIRACLMLSPLGDRATAGRHALSACSPEQHEEDEAL
jgi:hypothetical protein